MTENMKQRQFVDYLLELPVTLRLKIYELVDFPTLAILVYHEVDVTAFTLYFEEKKKIDLHMKICALMSNRMNSFQNELVMALTDCVPRRPIFVVPINTDLLENYTDYTSFCLKLHFSWESKVKDNIVGSTKALEIHFGWWPWEKNEALTKKVPKVSPGPLSQLTGYEDVYDIGYGVLKHKSAESQIPTLIYCSDTDEFDEFYDLDLSLSEKIHLLNNAVKGVENLTDINFSFFFELGYGFEYDDDKEIDKQRHLTQKMLPHDRRSMRQEYDATERQLFKCVKELLSLYGLSENILNEIKEVRKLSRNALRFCHADFSVVPYTGNI